MNKHQLSIFTCVVLCAALIALFGCGGTGGSGGTNINATPPPPPPKKGILAVVYTDLTKSIDEPTANRQKENIGRLFQNLPYDSKFYLFSIDRGTTKPSIYEFLPVIPKVERAEDDDKVEEVKKQIETAKKTTELEKLDSKLSSYHSSIVRERGPVSCIANKLNSLIDTIAIHRTDYPDYDIRVFFYSDMIEQCQNSFDAKPLDLERDENDNQEAQHLANIQSRIEKNFEQASSKRNLKSLEAKVYIILTSQDDKQSLRTLKTIWSSFFGKLGLPADEIVWANGNAEIFWTLASPSLSAQK